MAEKINLETAIQRYLDHRASDGMAAGTLRNHRLTLNGLLGTSGNIYVSSLTDDHISKYLFKARETRGAGLRIDYSVLNCFFDWCVSRRLVARDLMEGRKRPSGNHEEKLRVPASKFAALLDAAQAHDPRDRMVVALGLYLFLRQSEMKDLRVKDVDLDSGYLSVRIPKTHDFDRMPIGGELDRELRRWLVLYAEQIGRPLEPNMYLLPGYRPMGRKSGSAGLEYVMKTVPTSRINRPEKYVQRALADIGYALRNEDDESLREGVHTLRRSGARAWFDVQVARNYDGALRMVSAMLHHKDSKTTEIYLGLGLDRHKRDELIRGQEMFPVANNVVQLRLAEHG